MRSWSISYARGVTEMTLLPSRGLSRKSTTRKGWKDEMSGRFCVLGGKKIEKFRWNREWVPRFAKEKGLRKSVRNLTDGLFDFDGVFCFFPSRQSPSLSLFFIFYFFHFLRNTCLKFFVFLENCY